MITLDEALQDCQDQTSDTTSDSQEKFIRWLNQGYQNLIATFGRPGIEKITNTTTQVPGNPLTDSNRNYQLPPDYLFIKTVKIQIGSRWYQLQEEESTEMWNYRIEYDIGGIPSLYYINENFGIGSAELQIDPICTAVNYVGSGSTYTPTSGNETGTELNLTFSSLPSFATVGATVDLAGFVMASGTNINGQYTIQLVTGNTVTITLDTTVNDTITTMGTMQGTTGTGVPMQIVYESSDIKLDHVGITPTTVSPLAPTLTFTYNSNIVSSTVPIFLPWMALGSTYISTGDDGDGNWYKIVQVNNSSNVTIGNVYQSITTHSTNGWSVNQIMSLHVDMQDIPEDWALWKYYKYKKDAKWRDYYAASYAARLAAAKGNWATKSRSSIIRSKNGLSRWHSYPGWFPAAGVSS
jgi:hypothetical protein